METVREGDDGEENYRFTSKLLEWQRFLAVADNGLAESYADRIAIELTDLWPYVNEGCYFSGTAVYPDVDLEKGTIADTFGSVESMEGVSCGLTVCAFGDEKPQIYYLFSVGTITARTHTLRRQDDLYAFLHVADAEILPESTVEQPFTVPEFDEESDVCELLGKSSQNFVSLLRSTPFRRKTQLEQQKIVDAYIANTEQISGIRGTTVTFEPEYVYVPRLVDGVMQYDCKAVYKEFMSGICHGLMSIEADKLQRKAIRRDIDMVDERAGLCLIVEVASASYNDAPLNTPVLLPLSDQDIDIVFEN